MSTPDPDERPKWSFTWVLRIQRVGRRASAGASRGALLPWILAAIVIGGAVVLAWMGFVPR